MSRYHWLSGGISVSGLVPTTVQTTNINLPAGATVKRFQVRNCNIAGFVTGTDNTYRRVGAWSIDVFFTAGPNINRHIYTSTRSVPLFGTTYFAAAVPVYDYYVSAGDNEMAANQRCSYGLATGGAATLTFNGRYVIEAGSSSGNLIGNFQYSFAVLYYL